MRIDNQNVPDLGTTARTTSPNGQTGQTSRDSVLPSGASDDQVSLSNGSSLVALAKNAQGGRQAKINALQSQVRSGTYKPDLADVSRAMVQEISREASTSS